MTKEDKKYIVYKHTSPNGKAYIGMTSNSLTRRANNGRGYIKQKQFYDDILKYGWNNIEHTILFGNLTKQEACEKERELIKLYQSNNNRFGYNIADGGTSGFSQSEETKTKLSQIHKGKKISEDTRRKMSIACKGRKNPHTLEWNKKIAESNLGKKMSKTAVDKMIKTQTERYGKKIIQLTPNGNFINRFESIISAGRKTGINYGNISKCCTGKRQTAGGYLWKYE